VSSVVIGARNQAQPCDNLGAIGWSLTHDPNALSSAASKLSHTLSSTTHLGNVESRFEQSHHDRRFALTHRTRSNEDVRADPRNAYGAFSAGVIRSSAMIFGDCESHRGHKKKMVGARDAGTTELSVASF
jgi:hypothetical protein